VQMMATREPLEVSSSSSNHGERWTREEIKKVVNPAERCNVSDVSAVSQIYNSRKPKWWKFLAGRATKAQKRAICNVLDDHNLRLPEIPYGSLLDWNDVFPSTSLPNVVGNCNYTGNHGEQETISDHSKRKKQGRNIWLELGFGRGENLLALAHRCRNDSQFHLVGGEIHTPGIGIVCQRIQHAWNDTLNNQDHTGKDSKSKTLHMTECNYWKDYLLYSSYIDPFHSDFTDVTTSSDAVSTMVETIPNTPSEAKHPLYCNLRIHAGDGFKLLSKLPSNSVATILVTFPDPFPKEEEKQWRLIQTQTILEFHRVLQKEKSETIFKDEGSPIGSPLPFAGLFFLATDHVGYFDWTHTIVDQVNSSKLHFRLLDPCPNRMTWLPAVSTYEQKGWQEGRRTNLACWEVY
jgi:tRNA G46 methylase TrmB